MEKKMDLLLIVMSSHVSAILTVLDDMTQQHCPNGFSGFLNADACALRMLAEHGLFVITNDNGGRVVEGYWPKGKDN